ncbi:hypothetical protein [Mesorhizobium sp. M0296]|uniref:hypothetical protein n=1 Tax=Mesorhizobium sp. M0296 TaxID=2956931 RepID=UPI0033372C8A
MAGMIEKVARALALSAGGRMVTNGQSVATREFGWDASHRYTELYVEAHWREHVHAAGFAIQAMRDPTEAMVEAGMDYDERELNIRFGRPPTVEECQIGEWQAMIDKARSEDAGR